MTIRSLAARSLRHYWRTNLAVAMGVGVAVSALAGALLVGESVRTSLRDLALSRLGRTDFVVTSSSLFTEQLSERLASRPTFSSAWEGAVPVFTLEGVAVHEPSGRRAGSVQVYGVDDRFWSFNGVAITGPNERDAFMSPALARELGASIGDSLLLRIQKPSTIPASVLQGRRNEPGAASRVSVAKVLAPSEMGEFSPRPQQGDARVIFVPLERLQLDVDLPHRVNMMLVAAKQTGSGDPAVLTGAIEDVADLADLGLSYRPLEGASFVTESDSGYLSDAVARGVTETARETNVEPVPVLTYLATTIRANGRETPYAIVSAMPEAEIRRASGGTEASGAPPIWLTQWTTDDLGAKPGDPVTLDYYVWSDEAGLSTASASFVMAGTLPMRGLAVDENLTPRYPGISGSADISEWDPPFPIDLKRIRQKDEEYWDSYRTSPKAFVRIEEGQELWRTRYGQVTSLRIPAGQMPMTGLHAALSAGLPQHLPGSLGGFHAIPIRAEALAAAAGTTDFGEYFTYFSIFVVASSLLLTVLFFRLGIEQRASEIGLLGALGYTPRTIARIFLTEGIVLAAAGAAIGIAGAVAYAALVMIGLRTWWVAAVGTTALQLSPAARPLATGALIGMVTAVACIVLGLRTLRRSSARELMSGAWLDPERARRSSTHAREIAIASVVAALVLLALAATDRIPAAVGFFGSGTLLLIAGLGALTVWLRATSLRSFTSSVSPLLGFGIRNARYRPTRSVLCAALIGSATFLIVSVGAFRQGDEDLTSPRSGSGGYSLIAETVAPFMHDPGTSAGRDALNLGSDLQDFQVARFRLRPGDDASCLNLYRPQSPRLLGATPDFVKGNRFGFSGSIADNDAERDNPWLLLNRRFDDGAIPVIGDATSLAYVFHLKVGDDFVMSGSDDTPLRLRIVGALANSVLQSELIMAESQFVQLFPRNEGYRVFLLSTDASQAEALAGVLEDRLQDFGFDAQSTGERLAAYHRVENTFLSTFQALGGLGLVLGTFGLGTVLLRNVLERRRELALLRATGYRRRDLMVTIVAESVFLLACGLVLGTFCALVAIAPPLAARNEPIPIGATSFLLLVVFATGLLSTLFAALAAGRSPLLPALKTE